MFFCASLRVAHLFRVVPPVGVDGGCVGGFLKVFFLIGARSRWYVFAAFGAAGDAAFDA